MTLTLGMKRATAMSFFTQGAHTTLVPSLKTHTEDELDGCADEMDSTLKPVRPGTNGTKGLQLDGRFVSACDGSLPSTPDSAELGSAELDRDTRQLLLDFYRSHTGMCSPEQNHNSALPTMRRVVGEILLKHQIAYKGMLQRLHKEFDTDSLDIGTIAKTMFSDGSTNWGRITSLVAFGAVVCSRLKECQREESVEAVAQQISSYLISEQHHWLRNNNGWEGFVEFFREEDVESRVRGALMAVVGCAGIGAGLALLMR
ncbi:induced myeloid leukemia cell differentiation protein Mcl-1a [Pimephales promelas]|uniref:induced myeloid leukemia cell differentiation protein Mcl-1a n=1 Tax=Pimephales promelas TaxID=90988 RepID=UPI001955BE6C|nr:induced myeloid leukemia cell differentiation protein Mcl-1a [Pimephales promelas]